MNNRKYLEKVQKHDKQHENNINWLNDLSNEEYRKIKALEIIAWQLIKVNENLDALRNVLV